MKSRNGIAASLILVGALCSAGIGAAEQGAPGLSAYGYPAAAAVDEHHPSSSAGELLIAANGTTRKQKQHAAKLRKIRKMEQKRQAEKSLGRVNQKINEYGKRVRARLDSDHQNYMTAAETALRNTTEKKERKRIEKNIAKVEKQYQQAIKGLPKADGVAPDTLVKDYEEAKAKLGNYRAEKVKIEKAVKGLDKDIKDIDKQYPDLEGVQPPAV